MSDTQWPRYHVFVQEEPGQPHQDAGTVHATDAEMALLNARDVFARRPECVSMWVAPASAIFALTAEEAKTWQPPTASDGVTEDYYVFLKLRPAGTHVLAGSVSAASPAAAMSAAMQTFANPARSPWVWWVLPANAVLQSDPADTDSMYTPALDKTFRLAADFHTVSAMRSLKAIWKEEVHYDE